MSLKRCHSKEMISNKKKPKIISETAPITIDKNETELLKFIPKNTKEGLDHLISLFPSRKQIVLPPIIFLHQLYIFKNINRTQIDRDINELKQENKIKLFKLDSKSDQVCICYTDDLVSYYKSFTDIQFIEIANLAIEKFYTRSTGLSISKSELLNNCKLKDQQITKLIQNGFLTIKSENEYWHAIPNVVVLIKIMQDARKLITLIMSKKKFKEITLNELKERNLKKLRLLGVLYHSYDLIGSDIVERVESPIDLVIRLKQID